MDILDDIKVFLFTFLVGLLGSIIPTIIFCKIRDWNMGWILVYLKTSIYSTMCLYFEEDEGTSIKYLVKYAAVFVVLLIVDILLY